MKNSEDFYDSVKSDLENNLETAKYDIYDKIDYDTDKLTIYRAITVDDNWLNHLKTQGKRLGVYWSWESDGTETHWGNYSKKNVAIIEVDINQKYVDWHRTLEQNAHPYYSDEKEITLFKNTSLMIKSISINDEKIDISALDGKTFYS